MENSLQNVIKQKSFLITKIQFLFWFKKHLRRHKREREFVVMSDGFTVVENNIVIGGGSTLTKKYFVFFAKLCRKYIHIHIDIIVTVIANNDYFN